MSIVDQTSPTTYFVPFLKYGHLTSEDRKELTTPGEMEGETSGMNGVGESAMTQSMMATPSFVEDKPPPDIMTTSMHSLSGASDKKGLSKRPQSHRNDTSQQWFNFSDENEGRTDMSANAKEREEKVRRLRESQEEERKKKLEELKAHALNSQKFREQQENERRRHIEDLRSKDQERRCLVDDRRKEIEKAENERREALLLRNKEREERITSQRKNSRSHIDFAFGSSAPRLLEPRIDSGYWGSRSPGDRNSAEREIDLRNKRTVSAQGLDRSTEGDDDGLVGGFSSTAHRRRTDLVPTIVMPRGGEWSGTSRSATPSKMRSPGRAVSMSRIDTLSLPRRPTLHAPGVGGGKSPSKSVSMSHLAGRSRTKTADPRRPPLSLLTNTNGGPKMRPRSKTSGAKSSGISRENTSTASRPGSAMSNGSGPPRPVRLRSAPSRRPRPTSIATTGMTGAPASSGMMTASMYEERQRPALSNHVPRQKSLGGSGTPKLDRMKRARSVTSEAGADDDARSTTSSVGPSTKTPARKTPAQVKADAAARKLKATQAAPSTPKTSLGQKDAAMKKSTNSKSPSPSLSTENVRQGAGDGQENRLTTPDIIKNNHKEVVDNNKEEKETTPEAEGDKEHKNIISSEEEAKAKIALKRKEMKEKKEREEELERQRQLELERIEEERRLKEEEEERKMMEEADKMAVDARRAEEERIQKAIEEADSEKKRQEEEEERLRIEKEEIERKTKEEAEKREAELQEKLKKEEEERLARKKRIEEIMARTRGKGATPNTTPKKEVEPQGSPASQPSSLDTNVDPTKPDLLGDINHDNVAAENAKNIEVSASAGTVPQNGFEEGSKNGEVEKGALDSLSKADLAKDDFITKPVIHGMDLENSKPRSPSPLNGAEEVTHKSGPAVSEGNQFDQFIDLGAMPDTNKAEMPDNHQPIMAFEDSIPSPRQQQNTAELLS